MWICICTCISLRLVRPSVTAAPLEEDHTGSVKAHVGILVSYSLQIPTVILHFAVDFHFEHLCSRRSSPAYVFCEEGKFDWPNLSIGPTRFALLVLTLNVSHFLYHGCLLRVTKDKSQNVSIDSIQYLYRSGMV